MVTFIQHFCPYLIGSSFTIRTDHSALTWLQNFKQPEGQLARWLERLQEFQFTIVHRPGRAHANADALSRQPVRHCSKMCPDTSSPAVNAVTTFVMGYSPAELQQAQAEDHVIGKLLRSKQVNCRPSVTHSTGESLEYRHLLQQWDQLLIQDGLLWRIFSQPQESASWWCHRNSALISSNTYTRELLVVICDRKKLFTNSRSAFTGLVTTIMSGTGVKPVEHVLKGNHHQQVGEHRCRL